ncbi:hypothetical protein BW721_07395 [Jeotgalibaca sp. PTS2502]|uniref:hypothetical protein n=1 Tax=Jeotgalibaca sp. PTS2502 TaxID=1903686 RepID=UPI000973AA55|nr:hypothetical protein [Jeotgalibaca sp. PTS2502]APZ49509.1 hypothetical protein BW721_07395 [Jeotgalibaca sp. PTS2502]
MQDESAAGKIVTAKKKTQAFFTRPGESYPWTLNSESVISWTEYTYWTGYDAYYELQKYSTMGKLVLAKARLMLSNSRIERIITMAIDLGGITNW